MVASGRDPEKETRLQLMRALYNEKRQGKQEKKAAVKVQREKLERTGVARQPRKRSKWLSAEIVAFAGAVTTEADGKQRVAILACSDGNQLTITKGTESDAPLSWLYNAALSHPNRIAVWYHADRLVNCLLADATQAQLAELLDGDSIDLAGYRVRYTPGRTLTLEPQAWTPYRQLVTIWDVASNFSGNLHQAHSSYGLNDEWDTEPLSVAPSEWQALVGGFISMVQRDARLLQELVSAWRSSLHAAGIGPLGRYDGPGALATAWLQKAGVKAHLNRQLDTDEVFAAYYGGRSEIMGVGHVPQTIHAYDINSAYPDVLCTLPSLRGAHWHHYGSFAGDDPDFWPRTTLVHVRWRFPSTCPFYPLPYRDSQGEVSFPPQGEGWYWLPEVQAARAWTRVRGGITDGLELLERLELETPCDTLPFAFVERVYAQRRTLERVGDAGAQALKRGLQALYGKLAQQAGAYEPTYGSLLLAGLVTATVRAKLLRAALQHPEQVLMLATDAVFSTEPLDLLCADGMGHWKHSQYDSGTIVQSGVYWLDSAEKRVAMRGFGAGECIGANMVLQTWRDHGDTYGPSWYRIPVTFERFVSMRSVVACISPYADWRTETQEFRILDIGPTGKRVYNGFPDVTFPAHKRFVRTFAATPIEAETSPSQPHKRRGEGWTPAGDLLDEEGRL